MSAYVTSRCSVKTRGRIELVLARRLLSTWPTPCYKEIEVSTKSVLPSGTVSQTPDSENVASHTDRRNVLSI